MIFLLRHGEIETDGIRRFIGQTDVPLSPSGRRQAKQWKKKLSSISFDAIYASDLSRCAETARIISEKTPVTPSLLHDLREIRLGNLEGLSMEEVRIHSPAIWKKRGKNIARYTPEGGESFFDLGRRTIPAFKAICAGHQGNILIVTHAGVIRTIICDVLKFPLEHLFRIGLTYGGMTLLRPFDGSFRILGINLSVLPPF